MPTKELGLPVLPPKATGYSMYILLISLATSGMVYGVARENQFGGSCSRTTAQLSVSLQWLWKKRVARRTEVVHLVGIWSSLVAEGWEELVQERGGAVEEERLGAVVEVAVSVQGLLVAEVAVCGELVKTAVVLAESQHVTVKSAIKAEVVAASGEIIVSGERSIALKLAAAGVSKLSHHRTKS